MIREDVLNHPTSMLSRSNLLGLLMRNDAMETWGVDSICTQLSYCIMTYPEGCASNHLGQLKIMDISGHIRTCLMTFCGSSEPQLARLSATSVRCHPAIA